MRFNIYDRTMKKITDIETFISCLWDESYNAGGNFTLEVAATEQLKSYIRPDCFIRNKDTNTVMVIKSAVSNGRTIVATGKQAAFALDDSAFIGTISEGENIASSIKNAYNSSTKVNGIQITSGNLPDISPQQISNKTIYELMTTLCQSADVGFRSVKQGSEIQVEFYKPGLNPNAKFSDFFGNIGDPEIKLSTMAYKNYAIVLGGGEGEARIRVDVDNTDGSARREMIVDARDLTQKEAEPLDDYKKRLKARGLEKLLSQPLTWDCDFTPSSTGFGTLFGLGDIVTFVMRDYGLKFRTRITGYKRQEQRNTQKLTIRVGKLKGVSKT